jgi:hypothetical protein
VAYSVKSGLLVAFRYLLKPLVRMAVKNGVAFSEFAIALKQAYLDVAIRQSKAAGTSVTPEGISMITGIEATDVERMLRPGADPVEGLNAQAENPLPRILNAWHTDMQYTGPYGVLRDLEFARPRTTAGSLVQSEGASFSDLVTTYCPGISPKVLLDELVRTGSVKHVGNGFYRAISRFYVPDPLSHESIRLVAQVARNLFETLEVNLRPESRDSNGRLQRTVYTDKGLNSEALKRFDAHLRARAQVFANEVDDWLVGNEERESSQGGIKTGVGIYHYVVDDEDELQFAEDLPMEGE